MYLSVSLSFLSMYLFSYLSISRPSIHPPTCVYLSAYLITLSNIYLPTHHLLYPSIPISPFFFLIYLYLILNISYISFTEGLQIKYQAIKP